jgi:serine/threonine protein phosphatase PrpC
MAREDNQDRVLALSHVFAVADGMGGHLGGEVAAEVATTTLAEIYTEPGSPSNFERALLEANLAVWRRSAADSKVRGMGTTLTSLAVVRDSGTEWLELANVGDSRAYLFRARRLVQLTEDHSVAEEMVRRGRLTASEAAGHPARHILTRALGVEESIEVDRWPLAVEAGDRLLLCSDGLFNELDDPAIAEVLSEAENPNDAAEELVRRANARGGSDNISVVLVDVLEPPAGPPASLVEKGRSAVEGRLRYRSEPSGMHLERQEFSAKRSGRRGGRPGPKLLSPFSFAFGALLVAVLGGAVGSVYWYSGRSYYVTLSRSHLAIYHGRPGGVLWIQPKLVALTDVSVNQVLPSRIPELKAGVLEGSLGAAYAFIRDLRHEAQEIPLPRAYEGSTAAGTRKPAPQKAASTKRAAQARRG